MKERYRLARGGWVEFDRKEVQSVQPNYENTWVVLQNGRGYLLAGRRLGA